MSTFFFSRQAAPGGQTVSGEVAGINIDCIILHYEGLLTSSGYILLSTMADVLLRGLSNGERPKDFRLQCQL
jgi:hypothetical protein